MKAACEKGYQSLQQIHETEMLNSEYRTSRFNLLVKYCLLWDKIFFFYFQPQGHVHYFLLLTDVKKTKPITTNPSFCVLAITLSFF